LFQQNLNRDGVVGPTQKLIHINGSTKLTEVGNHHYNLDGSSGSEPTLNYKELTVTADEVGKCTPISATQTARGFDVALKNTVTGQYTVSSTDNNGIYIENFAARPVSDSFPTRRSSDLLFQQNLNRDGVVGPTQKLIHINGSTKLTEVGNHHYNLDGSSGS